MSVLLVFISLYITIILHELGHYLACKYYGLTTNLFNIGLGPILFKFSAFDTTFTFRLIPFMGYVSNDINELNSISLMKEWIMILSGVTVNLISSIIAFSFFYKRSPLIIIKILLTQLVPATFNHVFSTPLISSDYSIQNTINSISTSIPNNTFILILGVLSIMMFLFNLIPIPLLDGGQLIMAPIRRWGINHPKHSNAVNQISSILYIISAIVLFAPIILNELLDNPRTFLFTSITLLILFLIDEVNKKKVSKTPHS